MTEKATTKQGEKDIMLSVAHIIKHYCDEQTECDGCAFVVQGSQDDFGVCAFGYSDPCGWRIGEEG